MTDDLKSPEMSPADRAKPMTLGMWSDMVPGIVQGVSTRINNHILASARINALEARIAQLEASAETSYKGVWRSDRNYKAGNLVTMSGGMFSAVTDNQNSRPPSAAWVLAVKRGDGGGPTVA